MLKADSRDRQTFRELEDRTVSRKPSHFLAVRHDELAPHAKRGLQSASSTSPRRAGSRFPTLIPKGSTATTFSSSLHSHVPPSQASSEDSDSTTSFSRSPTPAAYAGLPEFEHSVSSHLSLDSETPGRAPLGAYHETDNWNFVTTPERSGYRENSHSTRHIAPGTWDSPCQPAPNASRKRKHGTPNRSGGNDGNDGHDGRDGRSKRRVSSSSDGFSCPYWMKYPQRTLKRSCLRSRFDTIPRLKEHLHRVHYNKKLCGRCYAEFEDVSQHQREDPSCRINHESRSLVFGPSQWAKLHEKMRGKSDEEKWREIWTILFYEADQGNIPPPHTEDSSVHQKRELVKSLEESVLSALDSWEQKCLEQQAGFFPTVETNFDISCMMASLRNSLVQIFERYENPQPISDPHAPNSADWADMPTFPLSVPSITLSQDTGSSQALASFPSADYPAQSADPSQTINLSALQMQGVNHQHAHYAGAHYPMQYSNRDLSAEMRALSSWDHNEASPYHNPYELSGYDDT